MNLKINYDFFNAIRNAREPMSPFKVVRNHKSFALLTSALGFSFMLMGSMVTALCEIGWFVLYPTAVSAILKGTGADIYYNISSSNLKSLVPQLKDLDIATNYDLLLESKPYKKRYFVEINKGQLPKLMESKYALVPSYAPNGAIKNTPVIQEHAVGSKQYVLSMGSSQSDYNFSKCNA